MPLSALRRLAVQSQVSPPHNVRTLLRSLHTREVRALAALIASPELIDPDAEEIDTLTDAWRQESLASQGEFLTRLDADPAPLLAHLAQSNARHLGRHAEALWHFWFAHLPKAKIHAAGLPVKEGSAVRGEFDFIVTLPGLSGAQHLEMGYKFYLHAPPGNSWSRCFGPNPEDRLDRKWGHMLDAQLPLSQSPLGRAALPAGIGSITPRACLQGWLFYPLGAVPAVIPGLSPAHWRGWWCRVAEKMPWSDLAERWVVLPRLAWIAPAVVNDAADALSITQCTIRLRTHFAQSRQAQLIAGLAPDEDGAWHETVRVFVVAHDWPKRV